METRGIGKSRATRYPPDTINAPGRTAIDACTRNAHTRVYAHTRWTLNRRGSRGAHRTHLHIPRSRGRERSGGGRERGKKEERERERGRGERARTRKANGAIASISGAYEEPVFLYRVSTSSFLARRRNAVTKGEPSLSGCSRRKNFSSPFPF